MKVSARLVKNENGAGGSCVNNNNFSFYKKTVHNGIVNEIKNQHFIVEELW